MIKVIFQCKECSHKKGKVITTKKILVPKIGMDGRCETKRCP